MSEAFDWLEANLYDPATIDAPDEAIDYIFMVDDEAHRASIFRFLPAKAGGK